MPTIHIELDLLLEIFVFPFSQKKRRLLGATGKLCKFGFTHNMDGQLTNRLYWPTTEPTIFRYPFGAVRPGCNVTIFILETKQDTRQIRIH